MPNFSKPPWKYVGPDARGESHVEDSNGEWVCCNTDYYPTAVNTEDMKLIAVAPELLDALHAYRECVENMGDKTYDEVLEGIDALITKATKGE